MCFSVVSHPAEPQVSIFIAKVKTWLRKHAKSTVFFNFSNHARAQVPIFTPKMKNSRFARLARFARFARLSTRKWDFRRRSRPRELAQRSQDDVSLNKLPQIRNYVFFVVFHLPMGPIHPVWALAADDQQEATAVARQVLSQGPRAKAVA